MFAPVYLDHNATTPLDERVLDAMMPYLREQYGNASSRHEYGRAARRAIDEAREQVAAAVGAHPTEVIFTSGGTEANNLFIKGAAACMKPSRLAVSAIEHPCVLRPAAQLARQGWTVDEIPVDASGRVVLSAFSALAARRPALLSIMMANNETGVLQPVGEAAAAARQVGAWLHSDAVQALGKIEVNFRTLGVHALTISAHKIGGPKGAGALIVDKRVELAPLLAGGGHERGLRSGTENVAAIVGFGRACELVAAQRVDTAARLAGIRETLDRRLLAQGARIFGAGSERVANTTYFAFPGIDGETLVGKLDRRGYAVASGSACSSANPEPSHVLSAMGVAPELARGAVRVSLGRATSQDDVENFAVALAATVNELKHLAAVAV